MEEGKEAHLYRNVGALWGIGESQGVADFDAGALDRPHPGLHDKPRFTISYLIPANISNSKSLEGVKKRE